MPSRLSRAMWRMREEFSIALARIVRLLDQNQIARDTVTLVLDKGSAALANTVQLAEAGVGWISALPWNQAPAELRERAVEELPPAAVPSPACAPRPRSSWCMVSEYLVRSEVLGFLRRRATAQSDHQPQPGAAIPAAFGQGIE